MTMIKVQNNENFIDITIAFGLIVFGLWLLKIVITKYKLKTFYDVKALGVSIASIVGGIYLLLSSLLG